MVLEIDKKVIERGRHTVIQIPESPHGDSSYFTGFGNDKEGGVLKAFIPTEFFAEINDLYRKNYFHHNE
jgi:hypothetical protein